MASFWWKKKGLIIPISLGSLIIIFHVIPEGEFLNLETINNFIRAFSLIIIGIIVSYLSELISKREVEFKEIMENLRRSNQDLQEFAYVASHDLQEPLRAIVSFSQLLEEEYYDKLDKEGREYIEFITEGAIKMNTLIKDLLSYSRITQRSEPLQKVDLQKTLDEAIYNLHESIKETGAVITHDEMPIIKGDKTQFIQLFQNLISNAIKFRSKKTPIIHIGVEKTNNKWLFSVKDNGIGIDSKYFGKLFNIFYRLHTKEEYTGTGIGLPICKKIVERYGGKIWVDSEPGKGSIFYFTILQKNKN
jgi:light-regulated signal transduction histidine kinase (bacteriophytochrome)